MLKDSQPLALLTDRGSRAVLKDCCPDLPVIDLGDTRLWANEPASNLDRASTGLTPM
jgi:hypothetical protein